MKRDTLAKYDLEYKPNIKKKKSLQSKCQYTIWYDVLQNRFWQICVICSFIFCLCCIYFYLSVSNMQLRLTMISMPLQTDIKSTVHVIAQ